MKEFLKKIIAAKEARAKELRESIKTATTADEVRSLGNDLTAVETELRDAQSQLAEIEAEEARTSVQAPAQPQTNAFNPAMTITGADMNQAQVRSGEPEDTRATMEYRTAFMNFVQRGEKSTVLQYEQRNGTGTSADLGVLLPTTIVQSIMKDVEKIYGQLYSRVRKTNIPGGVKYPIGSFSASFRRITETTVSERQHAGEITGYIEFSYNIGEIRIARTLLQTVLTVAAFEAEFTKVMVEAYVKAQDKEIMTGVPANGECEGILTEAAKGSAGRIKSANIIEFTAADMADWTKWQEKLFAVIPLSMRSLRPEFVMTANTYEANIKTLKDNSNRPLYNETFNPVDGTETATFKARPVIFVEDDILKNFNDATDGEYFGMYWVPEQAYCINSNLQFSVVDYFDQETNQYVKKAIIINDGKVLDPKYIYLLKKKVTG